MRGHALTNSCLLDIKAGCGLFINGGNELEVAHDELAGAGLTIGNNCTLEVAAGCGLALDAGGDVRVERAALIGPGLKVGEGECDLAVDCDWIRDYCDSSVQLNHGCGIYITQIGNDYTIEVAHDELAGKGLVLGSSCLLDVSVGCGLQFDGNQAIEVNPTALAGNGLVPGANCALDVDWGYIPVGCGIYWNGSALEVASDELVGNGLTLGSNCTLDVDCSWISDNCTGSQGEQGYQGDQGSQGYPRGPPRISVPLQDPRPDSPQ